MTLSDFPAWFLRLFGLLMGLVWGSFLNVVVYRVPLGLSVVSPASACPACNTPIAPRDNLPVLGYLLLGGKARCCKAKLSIRYPLVELAGGLLALAVVERSVLPLAPATPVWRGLAIFVAGFFLCLALLAAALIDLDHLYIPDSITFGGAIVGVLTYTLRRPDDRWIESLAGAAVGFLVVWLPFDVLYRKLRGRTGMAMGDAKLVMLAGAWFGVWGALFTLVAAAVQGTIFAALSMVWSGKLEDPEVVEKERQAVLAEIEALPEEEREAELEALKDDPLFEDDQGGLGARLVFGPFLALACLEMLFLGPELFRQGLLWLS